MVELTDIPTTEFARKWFEPILRSGATACAANTDTTIRFINAPEADIPIAISAAGWENSWVCSPWAQYFGYAQEEIARSGQGKLGAATARAIGILGAAAKRSAFNKAIIVNAWLASTVPFPKTRSGTATAILRLLQKAYPEHAIIFRGLNTSESGDILDELAPLSLRLPSRQVWLYSPGDKATLRSRDYKKDVELLNDGELNIVPNSELQAADLPRIWELYTQLYISKYSAFNPQYTSDWLTHLWNSGLLDITALKASRIMALEGSVEFNGVLTSPIVGYDLSASKELGLYRRAACIPIIKCHKLGIPLNLSAGVGRFKMLRGGRHCMEYNAVCLSHLPGARRLPWLAIQAVSAPIFRHVRKHNL